MSLVASHRPRWGLRRIAAGLCLVACGLAMSTFSGCQDAARTSEAVPPPVDPTRAYVEHLLPKLDGDLRRHAEAVATGKALESHLSREARRSWNARVDGGIKYADLFERLYAERSYHKAFAQSDGLTPRGKAVLEVLLDADRHALDPAPYHVARVQTLVAKLERAADGEPDWTGVRLEAEEANGLVGWLKDHDLAPSHLATHRRVLGALVGARSRAAGQEDVLDSPAPRITQRMDGFVDAFEKSAELTAELELRVADGALRYARDMKHFNLARQDWRDLRDAGGSKALIYGRLETTYKELSGATADEAADTMHALAPTHPQYQKLLDALSRYRAIAADGGWQRVRRTSLDLGARSSRVADLRERLAAEGFLSRAAPSAAVGSGVAPDRDAPDAADDIGPDALAEKPDPEVVDQPLIEAIKSYQETHQFRPDGQPTNGMWRSLNASVGRRIEQIELSIQRWRESHYQGERDFIMVNIPDFHAEVSRDGERTMRFRVVTGNKQRRCSRKTGEWIYPNATPIQMAKLDHVIVNPYWYVPKRIIREEIEPELGSDPDYLEKKNYEKVMLGGTETIRQKPGDGNALGRVKFIFPNPHNTYMHDTPHKKYFDYPVRAFSHGCIRVHKPFELARHLLAHDDNGKEYDFDKLLKKKRQKYIEMADKLPVFVEYYTVRVDDQGRPHFLADVYRHDHRRMIAQKADSEEDAKEALDCRERRRARPEAVQEHSDEAPEGVDSDLGP